MNRITLGFLSSVSVSQVCVLRNDLDLADCQDFRPAVYVWPLMDLTQAESLQKNSKWDIKLCITLA